MKFQWKFPGLLKRHEPPHRCGHPDHTQPAVPLETSTPQTPQQSKRRGLAIQPPHSQKKNTENNGVSVCPWCKSVAQTWADLIFSRFVFGGGTCGVIASSRRDCQRFPFDDVAEKSDSLQETNQWMNSLWNVSYAIKVINCLLAQQFWEES